MGLLQWTHVREDWIQKHGAYVTMFSLDISLHLECLLKFNDTGYTCREQWKQKVDDHAKHDKINIFIVHFKLGHEMMMVLF